MQGLLLGLANGTSCLALCAPVLIPLLLSEGHGVRQGAATLLEFLGGRLVGYLLFGLMAWAVGGLLLASGGYQGMLIGVTYVGLSVLLLAAVFRKARPTHGACSLAEAHARFHRWPSLIPAGMGLLAGLRVCPPLLLAFTEAASSGTLGGSLLLAVTFFLGTSLYFLPIPLLGDLVRGPDVRIIGRFAAVIVAVYYLISGAVLFAGGIIS